MNKHCHHLRSKPYHSRNVVHDVAHNNDRENVGLISDRDDGDGKDDGDDEVEGRQGEGEGEAESRGRGEQWRCEAEGGGKRGEEEALPWSQARATGSALSRARLLHPNISEPAPAASPRPHVHSLQPSFTFDSTKSSEGVPFRKFGAIEPLRCCVVQCKY